VWILAVCLTAGSDFKGTGEGGDFPQFHNVQEGSVAYTLSFRMGTADMAVKLAADHRLEPRSRIVKYPSISQYAVVAWCLFHNNVFGE
jgi:hypothetical protein